MKRIVVMTMAVVTVSFMCTLLAAQQPARDTAQRRGGGNQQKADNLPAGLFTAKR